MRYKILITDSDHEFVKGLEEKLEGAGYDTISAYEGIRAVEKAHKERPDLIILNWFLPTGNGSHVLEFLSEEDDTRHIPVIVLTGTDDPGLKEVAQTLGAKAFLKKPCEQKVILQTVKEVLEWERAKHVMQEEQRI